MQDSREYSLDYLQPKNLRELIYKHTHPKKWFKKRLDAGVPFSDLERMVQEDRTIANVMTFFYTTLATVPFYFVGQPGLAHVSIGMVFAELGKRAYNGVCKLFRKERSLAGEIFSRIGGAGGGGIVVEAAEYADLIPGAVRIEDVIAATFGGVIRSGTDHHYDKLQKALNELKG